MQDIETVTAAFRSGAQTYLAMGSPLYSAICAGGADDAEIVELATHAMVGSQPVFHLMASVHYLLLGDTADPLARFYATLTDTPAPAGEVWPDFARYCREHWAELLKLLETRSVQTTYVERCAPLMPAMSWVARQAGEPLNIVEIGCSAGVLLAFDKYAYALEGRDLVGSPDAPLTLPAKVRGGPELHIPRIASRTGLDLHVIDVRSEEERRWLISLTFPEFRDQRDRLATALDVVAETDIRLLEGDALARLPEVLADTPSPLCIFSSACLYYWSDDMIAALDSMLTDASKTRDIWRVAIEGSKAFNAYHKGKGAAPAPSAGGKQPAGEVQVIHYSGGKMDGQVVASKSMAGEFDWVE